VYIIVPRARFRPPSFGVLVDLEVVSGEKYGIGFFENHLAGFNESEVELLEVGGPKYREELVGWKH